MNDTERQKRFRALARAARGRLLAQRLLREATFMAAAAGALAFVPLFVAKWKVMDGSVHWALPFAIFGGLTLAVGLSWWQRPTLTDAARLLDRSWQTPELALSALEIYQMSEACSSEGEHEVSPVEHALTRALDPYLDPNPELPRLRLPKRTLVLATVGLLAVDLLLALTPQRQAARAPGLEHLQGLETVMPGPLDAETEALIDALRSAPDDQALKDRAQRAWRDLDADLAARPDGAPKNPQRLIRDLEAALAEGRLDVAAALSRRLAGEGIGLDPETRARLAEGLEEASRKSPDPAASARIENAARALEESRGAAGGLGAAAALARALGGDDEPGTRDETSHLTRRRDVLLRVFSALGSAPPSTIVGASDQSPTTESDSSTAARERALKQLDPDARRLLRDFDVERTRRKMLRENPPR